MTEFKMVRVDHIHVPERLREVEDDHALAIQASIVEHGLLHPIVVRSTPNQGKGKTPFTLVAGAHRLRAVSLLEDETEIEAVVVEADAAEAQLIEVEENLFRNELSVIDRAIAIQSYRDVWEQKYGKIKRGNPNFCNSVNLTELVASEAAQGFSQHVAERMGLSVASIERANRIAQLPKALREKFRGTEAADNQSLLLSYAKLPPAARKKAAKAIELANGDAKAALSALSEQAEAKPTAKEQARDRLIDSWGRVGPEERWALLDFAGITATLSEKQRARVAEIIGGPRPDDGAPS